jgi:hypothetical protein
MLLCAAPEPALRCAALRCELRAAPRRASRFEDPLAVLVRSLTHLLLLFIFPSRRYCAQHNCYRGNVVGTDPLGRGTMASEELGMASFIDRAVEMSLLGWAGADQVYPQDVAHFYKDDPEWRVML